jgi:hypothetical protein
MSESRAKSGRKSALHQPGLSHALTLCGFWSDGKGPTKTLPPLATPVSRKVKPTARKRPAPGGEALVRSVTVKQNVRKRKAEKKR